MICRAIEATSSNGTQVQDRPVQEMRPKVGLVERKTYRGTVEAT